MARNGSFTNIETPVKIIHSNLEQEVIQITEDKLRLSLNEYLVRIEKSKDWIAPFGILLTLLVTFETADFKEFFFSIETWKAVYLIATIGSIGWLIQALYSRLSSISVDDLISKIKDPSISHKSFFQLILEKIKLKLLNWLN